MHPIMSNLRPRLPLHRLPHPGIHVLRRRPRQTVTRSRLGRFFPVPTLHVRIQSLASHIVGIRLERALRGSGARRESSSFELGLVVVFIEFGAGFVLELVSGWLGEKAERGLLCWLLGRSWVWWGGIRLVCWWRWNQRCRGCDWSWWCMYECMWSRK